MGRHLHCVISSLRTRPASRAAKSSREKGCLPARRPLFDASGQQRRIAASEAYLPKAGHERYVSLAEPIRAYGPVARTRSIRGARRYSQLANVAAPREIA